MSSKEDILKDRGLKRLIKAFKEMPTARVGILGGGQRTPTGEKSVKARGNYFATIGITAESSREAFHEHKTQGGEMTNAMIGAAHEFGTTRLPMRSFLRVPISENLGKYLVNAGAFDKKKLDEVIRTSSILPWVQKMAITAEQIVQDAFATGGFGQWPASDMTRKENHQTLVETQQLRNSVTSEVK